MTFEKLSFTKDWNSKTDFPTYEPDEAQVRRDLQCLHDETRDFINETLIPEMEDALNNVSTGGSGGDSGAGIELDATLSQEGMAADAKAVGEAIAGVDVGVKSINGEAPDENGNVALTGPKIASGSYVGTGTGGEGSPMALTFDFVPTMLYVGTSPDLSLAAYGTDADPYPHEQMLVFNLAEASSAEILFAVGSTAGVGRLNFVEKGTTVSWYGAYASVDTTEDVTAECAAAQLNTEGKTYYYLAIGSGSSGGGVTGGLPAATAADAGKVLTVLEDGTWGAAEMPTYSGTVEVV